MVDRPLLLEYFVVNGVIGDLVIGRRRCHSPRWRCLPPPIANLERHHFRLFVEKCVVIIVSVAVSVAVVVTVAVVAFAAIFAAIVALSVAVLCHAALV